MPDEERLKAALAKSIAALRSANERVAQLERGPTEPIAIIGMACRLPGGVTTPQALWELLAEERDAIGPCPEARWGCEELFDPDPDARGKSYAREGGFIEGVEDFDADFFGISPREARSMDPQQRVLLEAAWEAFERAGVVPGDRPGRRTGVYVGLMGADYRLRFGDDLEILDGYVGTGSLAAAASGRLAYCLRLTGPAMTIDTACSSSLSAIHLACEALRRGDCELALAGGATVMTTPALFVEFSRLRGMAPDGRCKSFSARADGAGWSEGCGVLLLARQSDARRAGYPIVAHILGSAVSQDGRSQGLTAPNGPAQQRAIRRALERSGLTPEAIDHVEAHGTGTTLGDPIEAGALAAVFGSSRPSGRPLWVGSSKSSLGHAQAAAGVAAVIKVALSLEQQALPRTLHADPPSPHVDWSGSGLALLSQARPWPREGRPRRAGVSSFGISGTNVHLVMEEAPEPGRGKGRGGASRDHASEDADQTGAPLLPLSGASESALRALARELADDLEARPDLDLADVRHTAALHREHHRVRAVLTAASHQRVVADLRRLAAGQPHRQIVRGEVPPEGPGGLVLMFTGQGAQYPGMGRELYAREPEFRSAVDRCATLADPHLGHLGVGLVELLMGTADEPERIHRTDATQIALFTLEWALYELWRARGLEPDLLIGHSVGEIVAATVAGALGLEDGVRLVIERGRLMETLVPEGAMISVALDEASATERMAAWDGPVSIAAINAGDRLVLSGRVEGVHRVEQELRAEGIEVDRLHTSKPFHSPFVEPVLAGLETLLSTMTLRPAGIPIASNVTGQIERELFAEPSYWVRQLRQGVRFFDGLRSVRERGGRIFVEVGPHPVLCAMGARIFGADDPSCWLPSMRRRSDEAGTWSRALAGLHAHGVTLDWGALAPGRFVSLPTYPFQRRRFWREASSLASRRPSGEPGGPGGAPTLSVSITARDAGGRLLDAVVPEQTPAWIAEHLVEGVPVFPAPAFLELALRASESAGLGGVEALTIARPLYVSPGQGLRLQLALEGPGTDGAQRFTVRACVADPRSERWVTHATGLLAAVPDGGPHEREPEGGDNDAEPIEASRLYAALAAQGISLGPSLRRLRAIRRAPGIVTAQVDAGRHRADSPGLGLETWIAVMPLLALLAERALWVDGEPVQGAPSLPYRWSRVWSRATDASALSVRVERAGIGPETRASIRLFDERGVVARVEEIRLHAPQDRAAAPPRGAAGPEHGGALLLVATDVDTAWPVVRDLVVEQGVRHVRWVIAQGAEGDDGRHQGLVASLRDLGARSADIVSCDLRDASKVREVGTGPGGEPIDAVVVVAASVDPGRAPSERPDLMGAWNLHRTVARRPGVALLVLASLKASSRASSDPDADAFFEALVQHRARLGLEARWLRTPRGEAELGRLPRGWAEALGTRRVRSEPLVGAVAAPTSQSAGSRRSPSAPRAAEGMLEIVAEQIAAVVGMDTPQELALGRPLTEYGLDSLMAVEIRNRLGRRLGLTLPASLLYDYPTATDVAAFLVDLSGVEDTHVVPVSSVSSPEPAAPSVGAMDAACVPSEGPEPIAIVSMACRLPGAVDTPEAYWELLCQPRDAVEPFPVDRWDVGALYDPDPQAPGKTYCREGGFLHGLDRFDAALFGIAPREAMAMDPQQRLVLEVAWEALERAGIPPGDLEGRDAGVYIGSIGTDNALRLGVEPRGWDGHRATGSLASVIAGRLAYVLGLQGPAMTVDTACSSSLVAIHLACQALRGGECALAIAGGVHTMVTPTTFVEFSRLGAVARDGRCKSFSAAADGAGWAEGCGVLVLERLSDARRQGHHVLATIRGSAVNQDGRSQGLTAPNGPSQQRVIRKALESAALAPHQIDHVEAHGTGTALGDPIEAGALEAVFGGDRSADRPLWLGASKSNLGHTQGAAGVVGVMKVVLSLVHHQLPESLHAEPLNPRIDWDAGCLRLVREPTPWLRTQSPRRAGVSAFGLSGTNAHVVIEEAPPPGSPPIPASRSAGPLAFDEPSPHLVVLSSHREDGVSAQAQKLREHLEARPELDLRDVCFSLAHQRTAFEHRAMLVVEHGAALDEALGALASGRVSPSVIRGRARVDGKLVFVFPGQGSQWEGMARPLLDSSPAFGQCLERCDAALRPYTGWSVRDVLQGRPGAPTMERVDVVQPTLFAMMVSLAALWRSLGVEPDAVVGHSQGEIAAAHVAGALSLSDAARVVAHRSRLLRSIAGGGAMAMVQLGGEALRVRLREAPGLTLAAFNGPASSVVSGESEAIDAFVGALEAEGIFGRRVRVDVASHGPHVDALQVPLLEALEGLQPRPCDVPLFTTVEPVDRGDPEVDGRTLDPAYWYRNLRQPVRFWDATQRLLDRGHRHFVEVSPHPVVALALGEAAEAAGIQVNIAPTLVREEGDPRRVLLSVATLCCGGFTPDLDALWPTGRAVPLPTYAFARERHWIDTPPPSAAALRPGARTEGSAPGSTEGRPAEHPLLGSPFSMSSPADVVFFERRLGVASLPWLGDHRVQGVPVMPAAAYLEMAVSAIGPSAGAGVTLTRVELREALRLGSEAQAEVQLVLEPQSPTYWRWSVARAVGGPGTSWQELVRATAHATFELSRPPVFEHSPARELQRQAQEVSAEHAYADLEDGGLHYGPAFRGVQRLWRRPGEPWVLTSIALPESTDEQRYALAHPALLDACLHSAAMIERPGHARPLVPVGIDALHVWGALRGRLWCEARIETTRGGRGSAATITIWSESGEPLARVDGLRAEPLVEAPVSEPLADALFELKWHHLAPAEIRSRAAVGAPGRWLLLGDRRGFASRLARSLDAAGASVQCVVAPEPSPGEPDEDEIREQVSRALDMALADGPLDGVVLLWALDAASLRHRSPAASLPGLRECLAALHLTRALALAGLRDPPRLVLVTDRSQSPLGDEAVRAEQGPLWGFAATLRFEESALRPTRIDIGDPDSAAEAEALAQLLLGDTDEDQIALRQPARYVARLERAPLPASTHRWQAAAGRPYRLEVASPGVLDSLRLVAMEPTAPGPGQVEIAVEVAGMNFLDVLVALGEIPPVLGGEVSLGGELVGRICRVGEGVEGLDVGTRVLALTPHAFATHAVASAELVLPVPDSIGSEEAATLPIVHATAYYALHHVARLRAGERVLIHSAAGGVGQAALQWAQHVGAEVLATAGNDDKRAWLREQGVAMVSDSRSERFVQDVLRHTHGEGVDVVLNSLGGHLLERSVSLLRKDGRFVEIGKRDYFADRRLGLRPFLGRLSYSLVDLAGMLRDRPADVRAVLAEVLEHVRAGALGPLPRHVEPLSRAPELFARMAGGHHTGKLLLRVREPGPVSIAIPAEDEPLVRSDGCYLITGGLGGLGLSLARFMADRGAGGLLLLGRRGVERADQREQIAAIEALGTLVEVVRCDVSDAEALADATTTLPGDLPLRGIVHAAGVLDDALLRDLSAERFERVMAPKVRGAWNLHQLSHGHPTLEMFVLYSSAGALLGSPGQGSYTAANAFLDALARFRRQLGLPAISLGWGAFAQVGLAAAREDRGARLAGRGIGLLTPQQGCALFARLAGSEHAYLAPCPIDVREWMEVYPEAAGWPFLDALAQQGSTVVAPASWLAELSSAPPSEAREILGAHVLTQLSQVIRADVASLEPSTPFSALGVNSLMGVELRNRLQSSLGVPLPSTLVWTYSTPDALTEHLLELLGPTAGPERGSPPPSASTPEREPVDEIERLSEEQVESDLLAEIERFEGLADG